MRSNSGESMKRVADVLSESYELLHTLYEACTRYVNIVTKEEYDTLLERADKANKEFCAYFFPRPPGTHHFPLTGVR